MGKNVLGSIRDVILDTIDLMKTSPEDISTKSFRRPNGLADFIGLLPVADEDAKDSILEQLDFCSEVQLQQHSGARRSLADFDSYFLFNDLFEQYWSEDVDPKERLFFYPLYIWWRITAILPLRPREFILTPRDCIAERKGKYYLTIRRNNLKGGSHKVHYNISLDYRKVRRGIGKWIEI